ncbi:MAG: 30S ribosomal protein bS22 [Anaerolineae bacterium]
MPNVKKWRKRKMSKHKHRKRLKLTRWQRRMKK